MARIHLFEFEDLKWFPSFLRDYGTDFLQFLANKSKMFKPAVPLLHAALEETRNERIIDLASGGGGTLLWLSEELKKEHPEIIICLTDYYPNKAAIDYTKLQSASFESIDEPLDARAVPEALKGFRTMFLSFHHFRPEDARAILQNAVDAKVGIGIFEGQERSFPSVLAMLFSPLTLWFTTPLIRPFRWGRLLFTYPIPIVPLFVLWDGLVSSFRTYSEEEMQALVDGLKGKENYTWKIGKEKVGPSVMLYLIGTPKSSNT